MGAVLVRFVSGSKPFVASSAQKLMRRLLLLFSFFSYMSECMGHTPLIDHEGYNTQLPSDVDESRFRPESKELPPPNGSTTNHNLSHFVYKCRYVMPLPGIL